MNAINHNQAREYLARLDLSYLVNAMCAEHYPLPRWSQQDAEHCIKLYKNFLLLHHLHPGVTLVPTKEIDECWHNHILHTKKYHRDCEQIFGHHLHHDPAQPGEDDAGLVNAYQHTKELFLQAFGYPITSSVIDVSNAGT
jgi:hypothetical protein